MLLLWAILFLFVAIVLFIVAFGGVAIAISFFTKILFFISFLCFLIALILMILEKIKTKEKEEKEEEF